MKKRGFLVLVFLFVFVCSNAFAATEAQKRQAIEDGLKWLGSTQQADGRWNAGDDYYDTAATGASLLSFLEEGYVAGSDVVIGGTNYGDVVGKGLNFLFSRATTYSIGVEPAGDPESTSLYPNGLGVKFVPGGNNSRDTYVTGLVVPAIASTGTPNAVVTNGALTGMTYKQVVQEAVDYFAYGQSDSGWAQGGWRYYADYNNSDNSTSQWPVLSMLYASNFGVATPQFVKDELNVWTDYIQNPSDGGSYYDSNFGAWGSNMSRTGALLIEQDFCGDDTAAALNYVNNNWQTYASSWNGNFGQPYAMWAVYKGLELTVGLDDTTAITNLRAFDAATMDLDAGDTWNWWEDYSEYLVDTQTSGGNWSGYSNWNAYLETPWAINILAATEIPDDDDPVVPEPTSLFLLGSGFLGLFGLKRKK